MVGVTSQNQVRIRLAFKIFLEVVATAEQRLLLSLAADRLEALIGMRCIGHEVNAVQTQPRFQFDDLWARPRRRWRVLHHHLRGRLTGQTARVSARSSHRNGTGSRASWSSGVAEEPLPETVPPLAVHAATETGTPSWLVQLAANSPCHRAARWPDSPKVTWSADSSAAAASP